LALRHQGTAYILSKEMSGRQSPTPQVLCCRAFAATNWISVLAFVVASLKEWVRDFGMSITLLTAFFIRFGGLVCPKSTLDG
jgi:hypothetical protein